MLNLQLNPSLQYRCIQCEEITPVSKQFRCKACNGAVECYYGDAPFSIKQEHNDIWRFADVLPLLPNQRFSCEETKVHAIQDPQLSGYQVFGKFEGTLPSRSTKYRQCAVTVPCLIAIGINEISIASSGNTGSSFFYWANQCEGEFKVHTFVSKIHANRLRFNSPANNIHMSSIDMVEAENTAKKFAADNGIFFEGGFFNPFRREGLKTSYMEGLMQLDWDVDVVVQAVSSGMGIAGAYSGFQQLAAAGIIKKIPKVVCVQQDTCKPMVEADKRNCDTFPDDLIQSNPDGLAKAILRGNPVGSYPYVRGVVKKTNGCFVSVTQEEIQQAYEQLQAAGLEVCHTSATTLAAARDLAKSGWLKPTDRCLIMLTGGVLS